jgi:hypothetical protein
MVAMYDPVFRMRLACENWEKFHLSFTIISCVAAAIKKATLKIAYR